MKIITEKIEGYKDMTLEQKVAALESYEVEEPDYSGYVTKEMFDKTASELANSKKQLKEKMSAEELKAKEDADKWAEMEEKYNALVKKDAISTNKAKLLALGYEEKLADDTAEAMANGELDKVFANQKKHLEAVEKKIRSDILKDTPKPDGGNSGNPMTKDKLRKMLPQERYQYSVDNPEEYKNLYGGNE